MRLSIKTKQVAGVTSIVGLAVASLSGLYLSSLTRVRLEESKARGELLANAIFHRAREVVVRRPRPRRRPAGRRGPAVHPRVERVFRRTSPTPRSSTSPAWRSRTATPTQVGQTLGSYGDLNALLDRGPISQIRAIYAEGGRTLEIRQPLLLGTTEFGSIRIGVSTLLIRRDLDQSLGPALLTALAALWRRAWSRCSWRSCCSGRSTSSEAA